MVARGKVSLREWHGAWNSAIARWNTERTWPERPWPYLIRSLAEMLVDEPRRAPIHPSLTRPLLLGGAERELVLVNGTIIAALIFGVGFHWVSLTIAGLLVTAGHWALTRAAKYDARLSRIYVRHVRYQPYYPARPPIGAPPAWVYPSVED